MKKLFYKYPSTIGEELKYQTEYCKNIGRFKNNSDISLKMRELEKEVFGEERKYISIEDEENIIRNVRPATLTTLFEISSKKEIPNYFLLFSAFKALDIIKEDYNIISLLEYYEIEPSKEIDKNRLREIEIKCNKTFESRVNFCRKCVKKEKGECNYEYSCIFAKVAKILMMDDIDNELKMKFSLGLPSNFEKFVNQPINDYGIDLETLKRILEEFGESEKLQLISKLEKEYLNFRKEFKRELKPKNEDYTYQLLIRRITDCCCYGLAIDKEEICNFVFKGITN